MGTRMYQEIGLLDRACNWLEKNAVKVPNVTCPNCQHIISESLKIVKTEDDSDDMLITRTRKTYELKNGTFAKEVVQCEPWSSGPMAFFCLEITNEEGNLLERLFEWSEKGINMYLNC